MKFQEMKGHGHEKCGDESSGDKIFNDESSGPNCRRKVLVKKCGGRKGRDGSSGGRITEYQCHGVN